MDENTTTATTLGWHFANEDRRLRYDDNRLIETGSVFAVDGPLVLCQRGLHWSIQPLDALEYAPGPIVSRVEARGDILQPSDENKGCSTVRAHLWVADATPILHLFACWCAENALSAANVEDVRCWKAIEAKRAWLRGEISDEQLDAARAAARDAARAAARAAARDAARAAAWDAQNKKLAEMLLALAPSPEEV